MTAMIGFALGYVCCLISDVIWTVRNASRQCSSCGAVKR